MKNKVINCLIQLSNIEVTYTKEQWELYRNNEINLLDVTLSNKLNTDYFVYRRYIRFGITLAVAHFFMTVNANASTLTSSTESIEKLGQTFVTFIQIAGYWICFAKGLLDIIKEVLRGGDKADGIGRILIKYVLAFSSFYLLPFAFDLIRSNFSQ